jgi:hypothetical protein
VITVMQQQVRLASTIPGAPSPTFRPTKTSSLVPTWGMLAPNPTWSPQHTVGPGRVKRPGRPHGIYADMVETWEPTVLHYDPRVLSKRTPTGPPLLIRQLKQGGMQSSALNRPARMYSVAVGNDGNASPMRNMQEGVTIDETHHIVNDPADFRPPEYRKEINPYIEIPTPTSHMCETRTGKDAAGHDYASEHLEDHSGGKLMEWLEATSSDSSHTVPVRT